MRFVLSRKKKKWNAWLGSQTYESEGERSLEKNFDRFALKYFFLVSFFIQCFTTFQHSNMAAERNNGPSFFFS